MMLLKLLIHGAHGVDRIHVDVHWIHPRRRWICAWRCTSSRIVGVGHHNKNNLLLFSINLWLSLLQAAKEGIVLFYDGEGV